MSLTGLWYDGILQDATKYNWEYLSETKGHIRNWYLQQISLHPILVEQGAICVGYNECGSMESQHAIDDGTIRWQGLIDVVELASSIAACAAQVAAAATPPPLPSEWGAWSQEQIRITQKYVHSYQKTLILYAPASLCVECAHHHCVEHVYINHSLRFF